MDVIAFPVKTVNRLRRRGCKAIEVAEDGPEGWSKSRVDLTRLFDIFKTLQLKPEFVLRGYEFRASGNGNGVVWAMPANAEFPEPEECQILTDEFLEPPKPESALDDVMDAVMGDVSPLSYLSASLLNRELYEFGAIWHGCTWSTHSIIDEMPSSVDAEEQSSQNQDWEWHESEPELWEPVVKITPKRASVVFHTFSGHDQESISRHTDTYRIGSYCFKAKTKIIASGPIGYVF